MKKNPSTAKRFLSLLLALVMLCTMQGMTVFAEPEETTGESEEKSKQQNRVQSASPANPVHHCTQKDDGSDYTVWSHVYFGSYPQSEVTGEDLTPAITGAAYDGSGDAWVNGIKYRRISESDTENTDYFGENEYRYFKWERMKWKVLSNDGNSLFLAADQGLDCKNYNEEDVAATWESCTLRQWLNNDFYSMAFSPDEQGAIIEQNVVNTDDPKYNTEGGNDTRDKVYLLSLGEITNPSYGFCRGEYTQSVSRRVQVSEYAHTRGASWVESDGDCRGCRVWWLRSLGSGENSAMFLEPQGNIIPLGIWFCNTYTACVPVLNISLSSDLWTAADDSAADSQRALAEAQNNAKVELESYKNAKDYRDEQKTELAQAVASGKEAIDAAKDEAGVEQALAEAKAKIDQIKTDAQLRQEEEILASVKNKARAELESYKDAKDYRDAQKAELARAVAGGKDAIDIAKDEAEVEQALAEAKAKIDQIKTEAQLKQEEETLSQAQNKARAELESYKDAKDYRDAQKMELAQAVANGKEAIDAAKDEAEVEQALAEAKLRIDKIKTDAQLKEEQGKEESDSPVNPVHHCTKKDDGSDDTDWSYVYFGSYPQNEVKGEDLTSAITGAAYDSNGDAEVDGVRYRRISESDTNNPEYFGDNEYRYFKWERIKWKVLSNDGRTLFLVADQGLDCKDYNEKTVSTKWEYCTLRSWLNNDFYDTAFNVKEQGAIVEQNVVNEDNVRFSPNIAGGNDTRDKVYLLSVGEAMNYDYGFCEDRDTRSASRRVQTSDYARARGVSIDIFDVRRSACEWWLRSPGSSSNFAAFVLDDGLVADSGTWVSSQDRSCVPALHIDLASDLWRVADDPTIDPHLIQIKNNAKSRLESYKRAKAYRDAQKTELAQAIADGKKVIDAAKDEAGVEQALADAKVKIDQIKTDAQLRKELGEVFFPANPEHHCNKEDQSADTTDWSYVYFGSYPQTEVKGEDLTSAIIEAAYDSNGDAQVDGVKYRRISRNDTNYGGYFGDDEYRYFKWERIKWKVMSNDGRTLFLVADQGLDCKSYHDLNDCITWENCTLRRWLNNDFYGTAFSTEEQEAVVEQNVVNEDTPFYGTRGGNDTRDKVYLLSIEEVSNPDYGFCEEHYATSASRRVHVSNYAHARGVWVSDDTKYSYLDTCDWWLRSPGGDERKAANGNLDGSILYSIYGSNVFQDNYACVPALHINLSSDLWSAAGDEADPQETLIQAKTTAKTVLESYKDAKDYREAQQKELAQAIEDGKAAIDAAADEAGVEQALAEAKTKIDKIKTDAQLKKEEKKKISSAAKATLSKTSYTYDGKAKKPGVTVKAGKTKLQKNEDYTVLYKNNKNVGTASVIITGKGSYTGKITKTFKIVPKGTSIAGKIKAQKKGFTVNWKKQKTSTSGYQLQYSTSSKFTQKTTVTKNVEKNSTTKLAVKKLKAGKKYYVRVRTYKTVKGKKYVSSWSKVKNVKTKK